MIHYYVQRGFDWDKIASASFNTKMFLLASMQLAAEEEVEKYNRMIGKGKSKRR